MTHSKIHAKTSPISLVRLTLALALTAALGACEDVPQPPPRARPPVSEAPPVPEATPPPAPPTPITNPEVKAEPVVVKADDDAKHVDTLTAARKLLDASEVDKALELASMAVKETPKRSGAWNVLGRAELRAGKRKGAIEAFEKAVELNPRNGFARNNLGLALIYDGRYEAAVAALEEAVELEPVTPYMWNNLGMAYEQLARLDEARDAYGKAVSMESDRARDSLARLKGVETVVRTAKAEPETKVAPSDTDTGGTKDEETPTVTP